MRQWICTDLCAGESQLVAEWCAMAPGAPQKALSSWDPYYTTTLLNQIFERFHPETWSTVDEIPEQLKGLVKEVVPTAVVQIMTGDGELRDEELVRLYKSGYEKCKTMLLERYATKLHDLAPRIHYAIKLCTSMEYLPQFAKDVAQEEPLTISQ